jgi:hypothetical protein
MSIKNAKNKPWVVLIKDGDYYWPRGYFDTQEQAESYAMKKSQGTNRVYRIEKNSPTNPSIFERKTSVYTQKTRDKLKPHGGITVRNNK